MSKTRDPIEKRIVALSAQEAATCVSDLHAALSEHQPPQVRLLGLLERMHAWGLLDGSSLDAADVAELPSGPPISVGKR